MVVSTVYRHNVIVSHYLCSNRSRDLHNRNNQNFQNLASVVFSQAANPPAASGLTHFNRKGFVRQAMHVPTIALTNSFQLTLTPDLARHTANKGVNQG